MSGAFVAAENPGRAILAAEKPWAGYFGRGNTLERLGRALFRLQKHRARTHILEI